MMRRLAVVLSLGWLGVAVAFAEPTSTAATSPDVIDLAGAWRFRLDPDKQGDSQRWFAAELPDSIRLPGSTDEGGFGQEVTDRTDIQRLTRLYKYEGPAWYRRDVTIPADWAGRHIELSLERVHWESRLWVDDRPAGDAQNSLCVPHVYDLSKFLTPGKHRLTLCIDNTYKIDVGRWAHCVTEETQTNWNGVIGRVELRATDAVRVQSVRILPDVAAKAVGYHIVIGNRTGKECRASLAVSTMRHGVADAEKDRRLTNTVVAVPGREIAVEVVHAMGDNLRLWDEFTPGLYDLEVQVSAGEPGKECRDRLRTTFGMRAWTKDETHFVMNGRPVLVRGTLECCIFPMTGYPAMEAAAWRRMYTVARSYGLNAFRFHSWCPPEAAFAAADELGMMLQIESPLWIGEGGIGKDPKRAAFIRAECDRILDTYGDHPSFCWLSIGNELGDASEPFLSELVAHLRQKDPRHFYTCSTHPYRPGRKDDYYVSADTPAGPIRAPVREPRHVATMIDYRKLIEGVGCPIISHEVGQHTFYPDYAEIAKYTGVLRARNLEVFRAQLEKNGMLDQNAAFQKASGALSIHLYKEEFEALLRTPNSAGFFCLDLHDFPGQGTSLIGVLDAFWDSKGLIKPEEFRRFCSPTVPLLRMPQRTWTANETFKAQAEVAHYGPAAIRDASPAWRVLDATCKEAVAGELRRATVPTGKLSTLGEIVFPLDRLAVPAKYTIVLSIRGTEALNQWDFWVYPEKLDAAPPADVVVARRWKEEARPALEQGKRVLMLPGEDQVRHCIVGSFPPTFWCLRLFPGQPGTMGILCDPKHPALAGFPTDAHSDWQWAEILTRSRSLILDETSAEFRPIVQVIDDFGRNHKLGNLMEARVGEGLLMICSLSLDELDKRPAARQLASSVYAYMASDRFDPEARLDVGLLDKLFEPPLTNSLKGRPGEVSRAVLNVKAGANSPMNQNVPWKTANDEVLVRSDGFRYWVGKQTGTWRDATGSSWVSMDVKVSIGCPKGFEGTLYAFFWDWNSLGRRADVTLDDRFLGPLGAHDGEGVWLALPVTAKETADGEVDLRSRCTAGANAMISQIVLVPPK